MSCRVPYRGSVLMFELLPGEAARDLAEWGGAPGDERPIAVETVAVEDFATIEALVERLDDWAEEIRGGRTLARDDRMRLHAALAREPLRAVLMGALLDGDTRALLEKHVPTAEREALLAAWSAGKLPAATDLR